MPHENTDSPMQPPSTLISHAKTNRSIRRPLRFQPWPLSAHRVSCRNNEILGAHGK